MPWERVVGPRPSEKSYDARTDVADSLLNMSSSEIKGHRIRFMLIRIHFGRTIPRKPQILFSAPAVVRWSWREAGTQAVCRGTGSFILGLPLYSVGKIRVAPVTETVLAEIPAASDVGPSPSAKSYDASTVAALPATGSRSNDAIARTMGFLSNMDGSSWRLSRPSGPGP
jgi:hypothetical protein